MAIDKLRVFVDADALLAGSASTIGASHMVLRLAEISLITCIASEQVIIEAGRNLAAKLPDKLPAFKTLVNAALTIAPDPPRSEVAKYKAQADPKDVSILTAAISQQCRYLLTFNIRHYHPQGDLIEVLRPGEFLARLRDHVADLE